jgi:hypothetical protein
MGLSRPVMGLLLQGDSGGKVNIFRGESVYHCEKEGHIIMCLILNGY